MKRGSFEIYSKHKSERRITVHGYISEQYQIGIHQRKDGWWAVTDLPTGRLVVYDPSIVGAFKAFKEHYAYVIIKRTAKDYIKSQQVFEMAPQRRGMNDFNMD